MKKVKTFLQYLSRSLLPQSSHYETFLQNRFATSVVFFLESQVFFSFLITLVILINFNPFTLNTYKKSIVDSLNTIPANFEVSIRNDELTSNLFRPFLFWVKFPEEKFLFLVIDENAYPEKIKEYESTILLSKKVITVKYQQRLYTFPYSQFTNNLILTKSDILNLSSHSLDQMKLLFIVLIPFLVIFIPLTLCFTTTIYLLLSSIMVYIFYRLFHKHYKFIKIFQVGIHSSTLPMLIMIVLFSLYFWRCLPAYFPLLIILIFQLTGVYEAHYNKSHQILSNHKTTHHNKT